MAKRSESGRGRGRPKSEGPTRTVQTQLRSTPEWKEWLKAYADERQLTETDLINQALIEMARREQRPGPPKR